jgi:hypothetical protein
VRQPQPGLPRACYIPPGTLAVLALLPLLPLLPPMLGHGFFPPPPGADGRADGDGLA